MLSWLRQRGHNVTVFEKNDTVGGNILIASRVDPGAIELLRPINTLEELCRKIGVLIKTGVECDPSMVRTEKPDVVVIASGPVAKDVPRGVLMPRDIMMETVEPGRRIAIIGAGGIGLGFAVYLLRKGDYEITVFDEAQKPGRDVNPFYFWQYMALMKKKKVSFMMGTSINSIEGSNVRFTGPSGEGSSEFDTIVMSILHPEDGIWKAIRGVSGRGSIFHWRCKETPAPPQCDP